MQRLLDLQGHLAFLRLSPSIVWCGLPLIKPSPGLLEAFSHCLLPQQCHHRSILMVFFFSFHHNAGIHYMSVFICCHWSKQRTLLIYLAAKFSVRTKKYLIISWQLLRSIYWCRHQRSTCHLWTSWEKKLLWVRYHKNK